MSRSRTGGPACRDSEDLTAVPWRVSGRFRPLLVSRGRLFASHGLSLSVADPEKLDFCPIARADAGPLERLRARVRLSNRVMRDGFHGLAELGDGRLVAVLRRRISVLDPGTKIFRTVFELPRGLRPLNICQAEDDFLYFGEYFSNRERESVRIFGSPDGVRWEPVYMFPAGTVRHVHGVVRDPYRAGVWVLTGDHDRECGLWFTDDRFRTLTRVVGGSQRERAVSVIPTRRGLIVPTDSPGIRNRIQWLDLSSGRLEEICAIAGSAFYAVRCGELFLVSTVAEPSPINNESSAMVYASLDGTDWHRIARFPPDLWSVLFRFAPSVIRYPEVVLLQGNGDAGYIFGFGRSVRGAEGRLIRWSSSDVRAYLTNVACG